MAAVDLVVLEKPFDVDTFVGVLERALRRAGVAEDATLTVALPRPAPNPEIAGRLGGASVHAQAIALLEAARRIGDWVTADLWLLDEDMLRCVEALPDGPEAAFAAVSRAMPMLPGFGLPGRVQVSGRPAWIPTWRRTRTPAPRLARDAGLRSAAGVPLLVEPPLAGASAPHAADGDRWALRLRHRTARAGRRAARRHLGPRAGRRGLGGGQPRAGFSSRRRCSPRSSRSSSGPLPTATSSSSIRGRRTVSSTGW